MSVTLAQASTIVDVALNKAREMNLVPMTVAVLDAGGHLVAFKSDRARCSSAPPIRRSSSMRSMRRAAGVWSPIRAVC